jgi:protein-histidine N-methyltransferase
MRSVGVWIAAFVCALTAITGGVHAAPVSLLIDWMKAGGATDLVELRAHSSDFRSVHAARDVAAGEVLISVPERFMMTSEMAKASAVGQALTARCRLRASHSWLACYLLAERHKLFPPTVDPAAPPEPGAEGAAPAPAKPSARATPPARNPDGSSFWTPYIATLPVSYRSMPVHYDGTEWRYLNGSFIVDVVYASAEELLLEYENLLDCMPAFAAANLSRDAFVWARHAVATRLFGYHIGDEYASALVPFADMVNHRRPRVAAWSFDAERRHFVITAVANLTRGTEITVSYGQKCNSRLLLNYGFASIRNEFNTAALHLDLNKTTDPQFWLKLRLIGTVRAVQCSAHVCVCVCVRRCAYSADPFCMCLSGAVQIRVRR